MYLLITNCSHDKAWYLDKIGYAFKKSDVYRRSGTPHFVKHERVNKLVMREDCKEIELNFLNRVIVFLTGSIKLA